VEARKHDEGGGKEDANGKEELEEKGAGEQADRMRCTDSEQRVARRKEHASKRKKSII